MKLSNILISLGAIAPTILAAPSVGSGAANSLQPHMNVVGRQTSSPAYDDSRIQNYPDKLLLKRMEEYLISFATGDYDGMRDLQAEELLITDIHKSPFPFLHLNRQHSNMLFRYSS